MASLAGLLCSIRSLLAGRAGRLVGMLSGLLGCVAPASGDAGGLTIDAASAGLAVWAWAVAVKIDAAASARPSEVLMAREFICISSAARVLVEACGTLPSAFLTVENGEDSVFLMARHVVPGFSVPFQWLR
jgi:hypothetical protein